MFFLLLLSLLDLVASDCINNLCYNFYVIRGMNQPKGEFTWFFLDIQQCFVQPRYVITVGGPGADKGAVELYMQRDAYPTPTDYLYKCDFDSVDGEAQCALDDIRPGSYILGIFAKEAYDGIALIFDTFSKECDYYSGHNNQFVLSANKIRRLQGGDGMLESSNNNNEDDTDSDSDNYQGPDGKEEERAINGFPWKKALEHRRSNVKDKCYENSCKAMFEVGNIKLKKNQPMVITYNQAICHLDNTLTVLSIVGGQSKASVYLKKCTECHVGPDDYDYRCLQNPENDQGKCHWVDLQPGRYFVAIYAKEDLDDLEIKIVTTNPRCNNPNAINYGHSHHESQSGKKPNKAPLKKKESIYNAEKYEYNAIPTFKNNVIDAENDNKYNMFYGILLVISMAINIYAIFYIYQLRKSKLSENYQPIPTYTTF